MTDDHTSDDRTLGIIDTRGRAAATGVRAAVADRPVPLFDPDVVRIPVDGDRPRRRGNRAVMVVAMAALVLAVVGVAVVVGRAPDDDGPADRVGSGRLDRFVLGTVPEGFGLAGLRDGARPELADYGTATLYGPDEGHPRLAVGLLPEDLSLGDDCATDDVETCSEATGPAGPADVPEPVADFPRVELLERRAWDASSTFGAGAVIVEVDERLVLVAGASLAPQVVREVAADVRLDRGRAVVDGAPWGFVELGPAPLLGVLGPSAGIFGVTTGATVGSAWTVWYSPLDTAGPTDANIAVSVAPGSGLDVGLGSVLASEAVDVTVRGADAVVARTVVRGPIAGTWWTVRWQERPGEVVEVSAGSIGDTAFSREDVLALAEELVGVGDDDVADIERQVADRGLDQPGVTVVGEGAFSDGTTWRLVHGLVDADLSRSGLTLRTTAEVSGQGTFSSTGSSLGSGDDEGVGSGAGALGAEASVVGGIGYSWAFGPVTDERVASVVVFRDEERLAEAVLTRSGDLAGWVAELPADVLGGAEPSVLDEGGSDGLVVVALDAAGAEVDRFGL